ncbi:hypothetical protein CHUAL_008063 [Chamberlinius hualienensis]
MESKKEEPSSNNSFEIEKFPTVRVGQTSTSKSINHTKMLEDYFKSLPSKNSDELNSLEEEFNRAVKGMERKDKISMDTWVLKDQKLSLKLDRIMVDKAEVLPKCYPGERVFNLGDIGALYSQEKLPFYDLPEVNSNFDHFLHTLTFEAVKEILSTSVPFLAEFNNITSKDYVIRLLFQMLTVPDDHILLSACKQSLMALFHGDPQLAKYIGIQELLDNLINLGMCVEKLSSLITFVTANQGLNAKEDDVSSGCDKQFPVQCLKSILNVFSECLKHRYQTFSNSELSSLVITLSYIGLDVNLRNNIVLNDLSMCIVNILNSYNTDDWTIEMNKLAPRLLSISPDYENCLFIIRLLPYSVRGFQLMRVASYINLHLFYKLPLPDDNIVDVTPDMVLSWTKLNTLNCNDGLYWFYAVISFLDCSVNTDTYRKFGPTFKELFNYAQELCARFIECMDNPHITRVKNLLTLLSLKWNNYATLVPLYQKTLFSYLDKSTTSQNTDDAVL